MGRLVDSVFDGIVTFDDQGKVLSWNRAAERMFGTPIQQVKEKPLEALLPLLGHSYAGEDTLAPRELLAKRSDGSHFPVEVAASASEIEGVRMGLAVVRDITRRKVDEELARQALHDSLTGLPNRAFLLNRIGEMTIEVERSRASFALLLLDLDGFKQINDRLGHRIGDLVLRDLAPRLQEPLRRDDVVARLGGDEFAILLAPPTDAKVAATVAGRINHCVRQPLLVEGMCFRLSASIGIALHPQHGRKAGNLLHCADTAMYTAKRDRLVIALYDPELEAALGRDVVLRHELKRAIEQGELVLHYQPRSTCAPCSRSGSRRWCAGSTRTTASAPGQVHPIGGVHRPDPAPDRLGPERRDPSTTLVAGERVRPGHCGKSVCKITARSAVGQ